MVWQRVPGEPRITIRGSRWADRPRDRGQAGSSPWWILIAGWTDENSLEHQHNDREVAELKAASRPNVDGNELAALYSPFELTAAILVFATRGSEPGVLRGKGLRFKSCWARDGYRRPGQSRRWAPLTSQVRLEPAIPCVRRPAPARVPRRPGPPLPLEPPGSGPRRPSAAAPESQVGPTARPPQPMDAP
jgi:hypothetical protein